MLQIFVVAYLVLFIFINYASINTILARTSNQRLDNRQFHCRIQPVPSIAASCHHKLNESLRKDTMRKLLIICMAMWSVYAGDWKYNRQCQKTCAGFGCLRKPPSDEELCKQKVNQK